jgi:glutathione S-transferase
MSPASNRLLGKPAGSSVKLALFGDFSAADAMFAPVVNRLHVYKVAVTPGTRAYMDAMMALPAWQDWSTQAQAETWIIEKYEIA